MMWPCHWSEAIPVTDEDHSNHTSMLSVRQSGGIQIEVFQALELKHTDRSGAISDAISLLLITICSIIYMAW